MDPNPELPETDALLSSLGSLPTYDVTTERAERLRSRAVAALPRPRTARSEPSVWSRLYLRALEPAWVAAVAIVQVLLAAQRILQIYGG